MIRPGLILVPLALAGCTATEAPRVASVSGKAPPRAAAGLDRVMNQNAAALQALFGTPDRDSREMTARKLQFASSVCVLDAYLYPREGREPVVGYVDARTPAGEDIDRASCVAALARRTEAPKK
ncbi:hypothetical protein PQ455_14075 [Sphingomonas naphthae]|uniref:UrcA family protein n=1 Tax=Sphingomonas naphthae TaxID=1813468 RepID=A0ABY7THV5_9SPHN|nr:hypothetical protein [Sphingomonas naphthae]WCT72755.1 hypothetical protein PQ455_14075 [Sphingomonas naphthae]